MEISEYWRLCDELNIFEASLLVIGKDPGSEFVHVESRNTDDRPRGYEAAKSAISRALQSKIIDGKHVPHYEHDINGQPCGPIEGSTDIYLSAVSVKSLVNFLSQRGISSGFFFPNSSAIPDYLDTANPRYAPKLAAAINAWMAVTEPGNTSAKKALEKWLRENAAHFGMTDEEGNPISQAIEDCSKVANWNPAGGAPKTPQSGQGG